MCHVCLSSFFIRRGEAIPTPDDSLVSVGEDDNNKRFLSLFSSSAGAFSLRWVVVAFVDSSLHDKLQYKSSL